MNEVTEANPLVSADLAPDVTAGLSLNPVTAQSLSPTTQSSPHGFTAPSISSPIPSSHRPDPALDEADKFEAGDEQSDRECYEFQEMMSERIVAGQRLQDHPHMLTCERCRALVRDLEAIAEAASQLVPVEVEPKDELWHKISIAIEKGEA